MKMPALLAHPFRPFFLLTGIYAVLVILAWIAFLFGGWPLPVGWAPFQWHSHEMLYGLVTAAIAGFMLTAMTNWTGARPIQGYRLLMLLLLWLAGRVVMFVAGWLPGWLVAVVDLAFLPVLAVCVSQALIQNKNYRNLVLVAVLTLLFIGNVLMHAGLLTGNTGLIQKGELVGLDLIVLLIVIIAGRITPAFTGNWLRLQGQDTGAVKRWAWLEILCLASVASLLIFDGLGLTGGLVGSLALLAGIANGIRLWAWAGWRTRREPLLWILHLAYLWIVAALLLRGAGYFTGAITPSLWIHALGAGGTGTLLLGVMTRVAVGHTGRPLRLLRFGLVVYISVTTAAILRILVATGTLPFHPGICLSALAWMLAFGLFVMIYGPVLATARADGKPG